MSLLSFFGFGKEKIRQALDNGAVIIDVRTPYEFDQGHIPQSINIPVDRIQVNAKRIRDMSKPVILCCATGSRSTIAMDILKEAGIKEVYNGGSWKYVLKLTKR